MAPPSFPPTAEFYAKLPAITTAATKPNSISLDGIALEVTHQGAWQGFSAKLEGEQIKGAVVALATVQRERVMLAYFGGLPTGKSPTALALH